MAYTTPNHYAPSASDAKLWSGSQKAFNLLHFGYVAAPLIAGLDKFFHALAEWEKYLAPVFPQMLNVSAETFMRAVGVIEIIAGLIVAFKPRIGGVIVGLWLLGIVVNLVIHPAGYLDIALRDFGLMLGAFALAWLAGDFARRHRVQEELPKQE